MKQSIAFLSTQRLGFRRVNAASSIIPSLENPRLGIPRRIISNTTFLIGGSGGEGLPVTVPTTGQIYPRAINI